jgi:transcriptional regulator with XRE-family HTH domain
VNNDKNLPAKIFGEVLKELRLARGLTQERLADLAMMNDRSHISALERAVKSPVLATILALAAALNMPASEIIGLVEKRLKASHR